MNVTNRQITLIVLAVIVTVALPILAAITVARSQALEAEEKHVTGIALGSIMRSDQVGDQLVAGSRVINALPPGGACSPAGLAQLRRLDIESSLIQAVGHLNGTVMDCSSVAGTQPIALGPPDFVSKAGVLNWTALKPFGSRNSYIGSGTKAFIGIVHKDLLLSYIDDIPGLAVADFSWSTHKVLLSRGQVDPAWIALAASGDGIYHTPDRIVAIVKSKHYDIGTIVALPRSREALLASRLGRILIPLGVVAGLLLSIVLIGVLKTRMSMPMMIRGALRSGEFHLLYQPAVDLSTGRTIGAEALIRWHRPDGEEIPPDSFIAVAEQAGVIRAITTHVLDLLAGEARDVLRIVPSFRFSVNFSAEDIQSAEIFGEVDHFIRRSGLGPENLVIEATERSFLDVERAQGALEKIRDAGILVAIDDFGTGYSSLSCLAQLKIDVLKIDRLFVHALGTDSATSQVASRIIDMANDLQLKIVAEGIETADQAERLKALGVDCAQGFYFGRPMTMDALLQRLRAERSAPADVERLPARAA